MDFDLHFISEEQIPKVLLAVQIHEHLLLEENDERPLLPLVGLEQVWEISSDVYLHLAFFIFEMVFHHFEHDLIENTRSQRLACANHLLPTHILRLKEKIGFDVLVGKTVESFRYCRVESLHDEEFGPLFDCIHDPSAPILVELLDHSFGNAEDLHLRRVQKETGVRVVQAFNDVVDQGG